jgi:hypothetical protein
VDGLRDRVLDLEAGVQLQKERLTVRREQELGRAGTPVSGRTAERERPVAQARAELRRDVRRRRLLDDLLVAALQRALAFAEVDAIAVAVEQQLDLDMARALDVALEHHPVVGERRLRLPAGATECVGERVSVADDVHPLAAATRGGLQKDRVADACRLGREGRVGLVVAVVAGQRRDAQRVRHPARRRLVAQCPHRGR